MCGAIYDRVGNFRPFDQFLIVHFAQSKSGCQQTAYADIDVALFDIAFFYGVDKRFVAGPAFYVGPGQNGIGRCAGRVGVGVVFRSIVEIVYGTAIRYDKIFEFPLVSEYLHQQAVAAAAGLAFETVIGAHDFFYIAVDNCCLECREVSLI